MTHLSIYLFGAFQAVLDREQDVVFEYDKLRALLAYLVIESDAPQRREKLAGLLWPDLPERTARSNLRHALAILRKAICDCISEPPFLLITRQTIQFNLASQVWVDVTAFTRLLRSIQPSNQQTKKQMEEAIDIFRGPFLEGFSLANCPEFEQWLLYEREHLNRLAMHTLHCLSEWYEDLGEVERALYYAWRQVALDPYQDSTQQQVMHLLARSGQRGSALVQYETFHHLLAEELGAEPSVETTALYDRIRSGVEATASPRPPPNNLPAQTTPFIGRAQELAELNDLLNDSTCRLLTLVGLGGVGKTRLALEAAKAQIEHFRHGVFRVRLSAIQSAGAIVSRIAEAINFSFQQGGEPKQQLLDYLRDKNMLLILDNFEHLLSGVDLIVELLRFAPHITILVTSRVRLNLQAEQLFPVTGLAFPTISLLDKGQEELQQVGLGQALPLSRQEIEEIGSCDAVRLFVSVARRVCSTFDLRNHLSDVINICQLVEGLPLAVLLAAASVDRLSPAKIAARIDGRLDLLQVGWFDLPERQRSIRAVFDHSWKLLSDRQQEIFSALSVFRGGFTDQAAQEICVSSRLELLDLVDKSLLHCLPTGRYEMHELLRQYGVEKLAESPAVWQATHDRHCIYYITAIQQWGEGMQGITQLEVDAENIQVAWSWAVEHTQVSRLEQALDSLYRFYEHCVLHQDGELACQAAAERLSAQPSGDHLRLLARILIWQGAFDRLLERPEIAAKLFQQSVQLLDQLSLAGQDARREKALLSLQKGYLASNTDRQEARRWHQQSLALFQALGDGWGAARALRELGHIAMCLGDYAQARQLEEKCLAIQRTLNDRWGTADTLLGLATTITYQGHYEQALLLLQESLAISQEIGSRAIQPDVTGMMGGVLAVLCKFDEGHAKLEESVAIHKSQGRTRGLAHWSAMLGMLKMWMGRYQEARTCSRMNLSLSQEIDYPRGVGQSCAILSAVALVEQAYDEALIWAQQGAAAFQEIEQLEALSFALTFVAFAELGLGNLDQAKKHLRDALKIVVHVHGPLPLCYALPGAALFLAKQGERERAVEVYALVTERFSLVRNSAWFEEVAGRHIAAAGASLPDETFCAAQARGKTGDLEFVVQHLLQEFEE